MKALFTRDLFKVSLRLAFLQSTWCEGIMQSMGLGYCLIPGFKKIYKNNDDLIDALKHYNKPFNTHPFLVSIIAGIILHFEEKRVSRDEIDSYLTGMMGPLAALGDPFFRMGLAPFAAVVAVSAALLWGPVVGAIFMICVFNAVHVFVRVGGVFAGYSEGSMVFTRIARWLSPSRTTLLKRCSFCIAGFLMAYFSCQSASIFQSILVVVSGITASVLFVLLKSKVTYLAGTVLLVLLILEIFI